MHKRPGNGAIPAAEPAAAAAVHEYDHACRVLGDADVTVEHRAFDGNGNRSRHRRRFRHIHQLASGGKIICKLVAGQICRAASTRGTEVASRGRDRRSQCLKKKRWNVPAEISAPGKHAAPKLVSSFGKKSITCAKASMVRGRRS